MKQKKVKDALKLIVSEYKLTFGETVGDLQNWRFSDKLLDSNSKLNSICLKASPEPIQRKKYFLRIVKHLISEGLVKEESSSQYSLTKLGFEHGSLNFWQEATNFLNRNPGLISALALIVSVFALYISYKKP